MTEIFLTIFFISILLFFLGTGIWVAISMVGVSAFGMMLLPIAYVTFMLMMNSRKILGDDKPEGSSLFCWNVLMGISVLGAVAAALTAIAGKASHPVAGPVVTNVGVILLALIFAGFLFEPRLRDKLARQNTDRE